MTSCYIPIIVWSKTGHAINRYHMPDLSMHIVDRQDTCPYWKGNSATILLVAITQAFFYTALSALYFWDAECPLFSRRFFSLPSCSDLRGSNQVASVGAPKSDARDHRYIAHGYKIQAGSPIAPTKSPKMTMTAVCRPTQISIWRIP